MIFDWDENKERANIKKHDGIDFDEASEVFFDNDAFDEFDEEHSTAEETRIFVSAIQVKDFYEFLTQFVLTKTAVKLFG